MPTGHSIHDSTSIEWPRPEVRESLGPGLAVYLTAIILFVTLAPYELHWPPVYRFTIPTRINRDLGLDLVANVLLFMPVGFFYRLCLDDSRKRWRSLFWAGCLSLLIELLQTMIPPRISSPLDVATNLLGAVFGVLFFDATMTILRRKQVESLALELPLAGVFYLLVPILWLNALLEPSSPDRVWLSIPMGLMGGLLLGSIGHHRLGPPGVLRPVGVVVIVGIWIILANAPSFVGKPQLPYAPAVAAVSLVLVLVYLLQELPSWSFGTSRRFETATLWRLLPILWAYLLLDALYPWERLGIPWRWRWGFDKMHADIGPIPLPGIFAVIEQGTSHVVLGFVLAGLRNRVAESQGRMLSAVGLITGIWVLVTELLRGFHPQYHSSVAHGLLAVAASLLGAYLYRMHQRAVWKILGRLPLGER